MKYQRTMIAFALAASSAAQAAPGAGEEATLYCVGSYSSAQKPLDRIPVDAVITTAGNDVSLEIRTVGRGVAKDGLKRPSGFEVSGSVVLSPVRQDAPSAISFTLQNYTGELKVYSVDGKSDAPPVIYQGKCETKKPLVK